MKQHDAVITTLEKLGGQATLAQLYMEVMKITNCEWNTKTPFASIRRIVQTRPEIFKVRPGLYALRSYQKKLNLFEQSEENRENHEMIEQNHAYYQGLLVEIGNLRKFDTYVPNQDKNKLYINKPLGHIRSVDHIPSFSYDFIIQKSSTVDVIWFNQRKMPNSFFEVEFSTDIQSSLLKYNELQDFNCSMIIVADHHRRREFDQKLTYDAFKAINHRIKFLSFDTLVNQYQAEVFKSNCGFSI